MSTCYNGRSIYELVVQAQNLEEKNAYDGLALIFPTQEVNSPR